MKLSQFILLSLFGLPLSYPQNIFSEDLAIGSATGIVFSPDGQLIAAGGMGEIAGITVATVKDGKKAMKLPGEGRNSESIVFSYDGRYLASAGDSGIMIWDVETKKLAKVIGSGKGPFYSVLFSSDSRYIYASDDVSPKLWDVERDTVTKVFNGHLKTVRVLALSKSLLASGSWDNSTKLWDITGGKLIQSISLKHDDPTALAFSPDEKLIAIGFCGHSIGIYNIKTGYRISTLNGHSNTVSDVIFIAGGKRLVSISSDSTLRLWDIDQGECIRTVPVSKHAGVAFALSPNGKVIATLSATGEITLWRLKDFKIIKRFHM